MVLVKHDIRKFAVTPFCIMNKQPTVDKAVSHSKRAEYRAPVLGKLGKLSHKTLAVDSSGGEDSGGMLPNVKT